MANVLSWEKGLTKQWCKFDNFIDGVYLYMRQSRFDPDPMADNKWYPAGVPVFFTTLDNAKNPAEALAAAKAAKAHGPVENMYFWKGEWMTREELEAMHPPCVV